MWIKWISAKNMDAMWQAKLEVSQRHWNTFSSWSLEEELKGEKEQLMALSLKQDRSLDRDIVMHVDRGAMSS